MKLNIIFLVILFQTSNILGQKIDFNLMEKKLGIEIPSDYINYRGNDLNKEKEIYFKIDNWLFWDITTSIEQTLILRKKGAISDKDFAFATNEDNEVLFYQNSKKSSTKISHLDEGNDKTFYAFSFSEFQNTAKTNRLINEIETVGYENQDISEIKNCPGSLCNYASELMTSEFDYNYSLERNKKALELLLIAAEKGHPEAANEIADYYYYQDNVDIDKVIEWREKAIKYGSKDDIYELADFIIDNKIESIDKAITLLESLISEQWFKEKALLKLSRIYMRGTGGKLNYELGIKYAKNCAEMNNYNALSDLAFYYYKGRGVEKNVPKAYDLLVKAENTIIEKTGSGNWGDFIKQLEKEITKN
ncbi:SEL1-like repeat protein [Aureivirga sp. CE67]|uniref:SEL1-like repeat protein n=1 Tax=Aureivirga sp. CE67 TaxID=1788983 RepID=UPI0018CA2ACB|nr:SEL1-like repeat protein [Aureivirga sp. CE67]